MPYAPIARPVLLRSLDEARAVKRKQQQRSQLGGSDGLTQDRRCAALGAPAPAGLRLLQR